MKINFEFRKGLLFIRLKGILNKETSKELSEYLNKFINEQGVKYFVINLESLEYLDKDGLDLIRKNYEDVIMHNGKLIICGYKNTYIKSILDEEMKDIYKTKDELAAFKIIQI